MLLFSTAICLAIFVTGLVIGRRVWRNEWRWQAFRPDRVPDWWPYGDALWRGWLRLTVVAWIEVSLFGVALPLLQAERGPLMTIGTVAAVLAFVFLLMAIPIVLYNRPRFLVLPWLRHQPGALAEWRGAEVPPTPPPGAGRTGVSTR
jgi:hypothetical protein